MLGNDNDFGLEKTNQVVGGKCALIFVLTKAAQRSVLFFANFCNGKKRSEKLRRCGSFRKDPYREKNNLFPAEVAENVAWKWK